MDAREATERRTFLKLAALLTASCAGPAWSADRAPGVEADATPDGSVADAPDASRVVLGIMGLQRGQALAELFARVPGVEIRYVCDVDDRRTQASVASLQTAHRIEPRPLNDFRRILDDPEVDALVCAAPNHWHGPATILACQAGKHVYVEKPCSHNPWEGEMMIQAAARFGRLVQLGTQRRSSPGTRLAMQRIREGAIGRAYLARAQYSATRGSIGRGKTSTVPDGLQYDLWQGPAPRRDYIDNLVHYNWHWRWHWGNGELGNNGIHTLDLCRWGLDVDYPAQVQSSGGRYAFQDDQETPDTQLVSYLFPGDRMITWQGLSCNGHDKSFVTFHGTQGSLALDYDGTFKIYDLNEQLKEHHTQSDDGQTLHVGNFVDAVRSGQRQALNADIVEGHRSTLLCHLGNIAQRVGRTLGCNPATGRIEDDAEASQLWRREYDPAWEPKLG